MAVEVCASANKVIVSNGSGSICVGTAVRLPDSAVVNFANVGTGAGEVYRDKTATTVNLRTITGIGGITVDTNGDVVRVDGSGIVGAGEDNVGANIGGGDAEVYKDKTGVALNLRTISGTGGIVVSENGDVIEVDGSAINTPPGGLDNQLQINDGGSFGGSDLYWDGTVLGFGGLAATDSALKGLGTTLQVRLGDDSDWGHLACNDLDVRGTLDMWDNHIDNVNSIQFELLPIASPQEGLMYWDAEEKTLSLGMSGGNVNQQIGQEFFLRVKNTEGAQIDNGQLVYISGATGNFPEVKLADNGSMTTVAVAGMATEDIADSGFGYITSAGKVNGVDTSSFASGATLWLGTSGGFTDTRPPSPTWQVVIGTVIRSDATVGSVQLVPVIIPRLSFLSDVAVGATVLTDGDLISWDLANLRWDRTTLASLGSSLAPNIDHGNLASASLLDNDHTQYTLREDWYQNGFPNRSDSTLTWTDSSPDRTMSIQPTGASFVYYQEGVRYTSTGDTVQITDVEGMHLIYYDGSTLTSLANPTDAQVDSAIRTKALVSYVYWDTSAGAAIYVGEERHGSSMSPSSHSYHHFLDGLRWVAGLALNTISADGAGATADAQFGVDAGSVADEDIYSPISPVASTTGLPIYYMLGASAEWQRHIESGFSARTYDGTSATRLAWNEYTGGAWQLTEVANNDFVLCHIFSTTEKDTPMIAIMGQNDYSTVIAARNGALEEIYSLQLNDLAFPEIRPVGTVIFQTNLSYASAINARVRTTDEGDDYIDWRSDSVSRAVISTTQHGALTGLLDDDHTQYILADGTRAFTGQILAAAGGTSAPAYSFNGNTGTGMTVAFANNLNFSVGGSLKWSIDPSDRWVSNGGVILSAAGTAAAPGYAFKTADDVDTGMFRAAEDELGFATAGVERGRFGASGALTITGGSDTEQLIIKAHSAQTNANPLLELQDSIGTSLCSLSSDDVTNLFIGIGAGASNTATAVNNVFVGNLAGNSNQTGKGVVAIGRTSSYLATDADNVVAIGLNACQNNQSDRIVGIGTNSVFSNTSGAYNFAMGMNSLRYNQVGGSNICLGDAAGQGSSGNSFSNAVFIGRNAGFSNQTGGGMVCIGRDSGYSNTTGSNCFFAGYEAGYSNSTASTNFALGGASLKYNQTGINNTAIGFEAGRGVSGHSISGNLLLGSAAGQNLETGGDDNTCLGVSSGQLLSSGADNILGGARSGDNLTTGSRNIIIGTGLDASSATVNDELNIGDAIKGDLSTGDIQLVADVEIDGDLNHDGSNVGFYGTAPTAQSAAYTPTNVSTDRSYDADSTTLDEIADVLGTLIADLQATGLIG